jgi:hypothetical protein
MTRRTVVVAIAVSLGAASALAGCGGSQQPTDAEARHYAFDVLASGMRSATTLPAPYEALSGALPNRLYDVAGPQVDPQSMTAVVVVGDVTNVAEGYGYYMPEGDAPSGTQIAFDDERAMWRTVHATVVVDEVLGEASGAVVGEEPSGGVGNAVEVRFPLYPGQAFDEYKQGLESIDSAVFFLSVGSDQKGEAEYVPTQGNLIATIEAGTLALPVVAEGSEQAATDLLHGVSTVAELQDAATEPTKIIQVEAGSPESVVLSAG